MSAHRRAGQCAYRGAEGSAFDTAFDGRLVGGRASGLAKSELPAIGVVGAELIETLARAGHRHDARAGGDGRARAEYQQRCQRRNTQ
jgi:hypothetical protein